jgi:hypothetical protein
MLKYLDKLLKFIFMNFRYFLKIFLVQFTFQNFQLSPIYPFAMVSYQQNYHQNHLRCKNWFCNSVKKTRRHQVDIFLILSWALLTSSVRAEGSWTEPINVHALLMGHIVFVLGQCSLLYLCPHSIVIMPKRQSRRERKRYKMIVTRHTLCLKTAWQPVWPVGTSHVHHQPPL